MSRKRKLLVSGNWKMNMTHFEAIQFVQELAALLRAAPLGTDRELSLHPPFTALRSVQTAVESDSVAVTLGAQDCHEADKGAFTGEVSAEMLSKLNISLVIVGHSERRQHFGESDERVRAKCDSVLSKTMTPILCVGETLEERQDGQAKARVSTELEAALGRRKQEVVGSFVVAYEPIWAIGTGETATAGDAQEMASHIRSEIGRIAGMAAAEAVRVQYGGSVTPENAAELLGQRDVDGLLVGGQSLRAESLYQIASAG